MAWIEERPTKIVVDLISGAVTTVELTDEDLEQRDKDIKEQSKLTKEEQQLEEKLWKE